MSDTGLLPGTTHDISMVAAKLGIAGALQDIQNNHPNDMVSLDHVQPPQLLRRAGRRPGNSACPA